MKKSVFLWGTLLFILSLTCFPLFSGNNNLLSLSQVMRPGLGLLDSDGDHWPDKIAWRIILPENPSAAELAAAADVAARFNFESLAVNMNLVFSSPVDSPRPSSFLPIYLEIVASENTSLSPPPGKNLSIRSSRLSPNSRPGHLRRDAPSGLPGLFPALALPLGNLGAGERSDLQSGGKRCFKLSSGKRSQSSRNLHPGGTLPIPATRLSFFFTEKTPLRRK